MNQAPRSLGTLRPDLPWHVIRTIDQMLATDPADRPASALEVLGALFPGGTIGEADPSGGQQLCTLPITGPNGPAYFLMTPSLLPYDDRLQNDTALGFTISQLDGIGDRAYYSPGNATYAQADLVFELAGTPYSIRATYTDSGLTMPTEPTVQDGLMSIAAAWAATL